MPCVDCKFWAEFEPAPEDPPSERHGTCGWFPPSLPHSWRYATREVVGTYGDDCATFSPKIAEDRRRWPKLT